MQIKHLVLIFVIVWSLTKIAGLLIDYSFRRERLKIEKQQIERTSRVSIEMLKAVQEASIELIKSLKE
jgi:hypothetical protein